MNKQTIWNGFEFHDLKRESFESTYICQRDSHIIDTSLAEKFTDIYSKAGNLFFLGLSYRVIIINRLISGEIIPQSLEPLVPFFFSINKN